MRLVADWDEVARIAPALPGTTEVACSPTSHVDGRAAVLCRLDRLDETSLTEPAGEARVAGTHRRLVVERPLPTGA